ncbi:MAG TPA: Hpt domain-containing protein [Caulobacteraceae bacterium]
MGDSNQAQVIPPSNNLKLKVGGGRFSLDADSIARAEAALKSLSGQFAQWMQDELVKLDAARAEIRSKGLTPETAEGLYMRAHDLKGLGATYEFPLVTRIAASLCRLIDEPATRMAAPLTLVDAHIDAIKAVVRDDIKSEDHPMGRAISEELETKTRDHLK